jgi:hypothetical protein
MNIKFDDHTKLKTIKSLFLEILIRVQNSTYFY